MIRIYFGSPGCGKTSLIAFFTQKYFKQYHLFKRLYKIPRYDYVLSNVPIINASPFDVRDLDSFSPYPRSLLLIDEGGIVYNNRKFKDMPQGTIEFLKLHRHYNCDISVFSQSWEDLDITIRRLCDEIYKVQKIGQFTFTRLIQRRVGIDKETKQIVDQFHQVPLVASPFVPAENAFFFRPFYYKFFDSFETPDRPFLQVDHL